MAWWTIPLIAGGVSFAASKLSGASTGDSLKSGILGFATSYGVGALGKGLTAAGKDLVLGESLKAGAGSEALRSGIQSGTVASGSPIAQDIAMGGKFINPGTYSSAITGTADNVGAVFGRGLQNVGNYLNTSGKQLGLGATLGSSYALGRLEPPKVKKPYNPFESTPEQRAALLQRETDKLSGLTQAYDYSNEPAQMDPYNFSNMLYAKEGAFVEGIAQYATGGVNYLPSKIEKDENDVNNYVRATGYVEDGSGVGDKDEDTMLAQLADGEFVSRADAILGAGIMAGANPEDFKDMRKKGAAFFYNQQDQLKRVYDLVSA
jgi:hypothetical protein